MEVVVYVDGVESFSQDVMWCIYEGDTYVLLRTLRKERQFGEGGQRVRWNGTLHLQIDSHRFDS